MPPHAALAARFRDALRARPGRAAARAALERARVLAAAEATPHEVRAALAALARDPDVARTLAWPAIEALREAREATDAALDRRLAAALQTDPLDGLAAELTACGDDADRAGRAVDLAWRHLGPPNARAAARLVDLLRAHPLGPARVVVLARLVAHGADVRAALADDATLDAEARAAVLAAYAARRADAGELRPVAWAPDPRAALARALADWTRHATHPRQLFFAFRRAAGLHDEGAYAAALAGLARWPLAPEVRAQYERERHGGPAPVPARQVGAGRFECGRCGDARVRATERHLLDARDPTEGAETEFVCAACELRFFAAWDITTLDGAAPPPPRGWATA